MSVSLAEARPEAGRPISERIGRLPVWVLPMLLAVVAASVRLFAFVGICRLDMFRYIEISHHVLNGGSLFDPQVFYASARLPLMLPLLASNGLFGYGEHVSVAWPLLCSIGIVVVTYLLGRELFGDLVGFIGGGIMAVFPMEIELGTQLLPDPIEGFFLVAAIYLGVLCVTRDDRWRLYAILSGVSLIVAYETRVNAIIFLLGILVAGALLRPDKWKRPLWVLAGMVVGLALFAAAFWLLSGDPIIDIHKTREFYASYQDTGFIERKSTFIGLLTSEKSLLLALPLAAVGLVGLLAAPKDRGRWFLFTWIAAFYVYLDVVSPLHGLDSSYRYTEPMMPAIALLCAAALGDLFRGRRTVTKILMIAVAALVALGMVWVGDNVADKWRANTRWTAMRQVAAFIADKPEAVVYTDDVYKFVSLNYYSGFSLGRDGLEPPGARVNAGSRLFLLSEQTPSPGDESYVVTDEPKLVPEGIEPLMTLRFPKRPAFVFQPE